MTIASSTKNSSLLIGEKIIVLGIAFLNNVLLARLAGPEVFGQYNYILSYVAIFIPFCSMGINHISSKYFIRYSNNSHHYLSSALILRAIGAIIGFLTCILLSLIIRINETDLTLILILLLFQCSSIFNLIEYYFLAKNNVAITLKVRLLCYSLTGAFKACLIINHADIFWLIILHGLETFLISLAYIYIYKSGKHHLYIKKPFSIKSILSFFHKGKWLILSSLSAVIYLKIDQIMIANILNNEEVAFYAAAVKLSEFWYVFPILVANAFNAQLVMSHSSSKVNFQNTINNLLTIMVIAAISISLITFFIAPVLITQLYGRSIPKEYPNINRSHFCDFIYFSKSYL